MDKQTIMEQREIRDLALGDTVIIKDEAKVVSEIDSIYYARSGKRYDIGFSDGRWIRKQNPASKIPVLVTAKALIVALLTFISIPNSFAGDLSPHFSRYEFNQRRAPLETDQIVVDPSLIYRLEALRALVNKPIVVHSGYRTEAYNKSVGGAEHSQHLHGKAADISVAGITPEELAVFAKQAGFTFIKIYPGHLHVDVR